MAALRARAATGRSMPSGARRWNTGKPVTSDGAPHVGPQGPLPLLAGPAFGAAPKGNRWHVITIGNLSRNRYWGESDAKPLRSAICTCTLIGGDGFQLLVDPSLANKDEMAKELDRRTGRKLDDVTAVFVTHEHPDHYAGLEHFTKAAWFAAPPIAQMLNRAKTFARKLESAPAKLFDAVEVLATPGHSAGHHSLRFALRRPPRGSCRRRRHDQGFLPRADRLLRFQRRGPGFKDHRNARPNGRYYFPGHDNYFYV